MKAGIIGTGAVAHKHARALQNIGYRVTAVANRGEAAGREFAARYGAAFAGDWQEVCRHPEVDFVDVCTFPEFRLEAVELCAATGKHLMVEKPMATSLETAGRMIETARRGGIRPAVSRLVAMGFSTIRCF